MGCPLFKRALIFRAFTHGQRRLCARVRLRARGRASVRARFRFASEYEVLGFLHLFLHTSFVGIPGGGG